MMLLRPFILTLLLMFTATVAVAQPDRTFKIKNGTSMPPALAEKFPEESNAYLIQFITCESKRCGESLKALQEFIAGPLQDESLAVLGIAVRNSNDDVTSIAKELQLTFPLVADQSGDLFSTIARDSVPRTLIFDADQKLVYRHTGYAPGREAEFRAVVQALLDGKPIPEEYLVNQQDPVMDKGRSSLMAKDIRGQQAPEIPVETWINKAPSSDGKYVLVDLWATWCGPCIMALNMAEPLHHEFEDRLVTMAISDESVGQVTRFVKSQGWKQPIGIDTQRRLLDQLQVRGIPHGFIADPNGKVIWQGNPMALWMNDASALRELLPAKKEPVE